MWNWAENQIRLLFIRHGKTAENKEHRYLGKTDSPLCEEGYDSLQKAVESQCYPTIHYLFSSPMKRCLETAAIIYADMPCSIISEWEEMDFGDFECKSYLELKDNGDYQEWIDSNGSIPFPNGESKEEFTLRCKVGFQKMMAQLLEMRRNSTPKISAGNDKLTIGIIVHGGTIMALLSEYYGGNYFDYQVSNGCGYLCDLALGSELRIVRVEKIVVAKIKWN